MKNIIIVDASPRHHGNCDMAAERIAAGLSGSNVQIFKLRERTVKPCMACEYCKKQEHPECVQKDDMGTLIPMIENCDGIVILTPIYFGQISGPAKNFIDRLYCFFNLAKPNMSMTEKYGKKGALIGFCGKGPVDVYSKYLKDTGMCLQTIGVTNTRLFICGNVNEPGSCMKSEECVAKLDSAAGWLSE